MPDTASLRLVAYLRVSSSGQLDGLGLDVQRDQVTKWAASHGHVVVRWCVDEAVSGTTDAVDRDGLSCALGAIPEDADAVVIAKFDRLARSLTVQEAILAMIWRSGGKVFTADQGEILADDPDDPMRTAMRQMAGVFAELDRAMIVKRLRDARKLKASRGGKAVGRYPFGETISGPEPREVAVLERVAALRTDGNTWAAIAAELNAGGSQYAPRTAATWSTANLHSTARRAGIE